MTDAVTFSGAAWSPERVGLALRESGRAVTDLLAAAPPGSLPVPGLDWTVGETAAHLVTVVRRALGDSRRSSSPEGTAALNAVVLGEMEEREPQVLAALLRSDLELVVTQVLPAVPPEATVPFHAGARVPVLEAFGAMVVELVVHGHDLARATQLPIGRSQVAESVAAEAFIRLAPHWVDPGTRRTARQGLRLTGGRRRTLVLTGGSLGWRSGAREASVVALDDLDLMLMLAGRQDPATPDLRALREALLPL